MPRFSANLGFLWTDRSLPQAIRAAAAAGFDAVECHYPYATPPAEVRAALEATGLPMLSLNTAIGETFGLAAIAGREAEARAGIDAALDYAAATDTRAVHVLAGKARGAAARAVYLDNLAYAAERAAASGRTILLEALNPHDVPGYHIRATGEAAEVIEALGAGCVKLMFDCYHVGRTEGDVLARFHALRPMIGHVQIASVPDRRAPDHGEVDFRALFAELDATGWPHPLGAEYSPDGETDHSLGWLKALAP